MAEKSYVRAINDALREEMHRDPLVCVFGVDVARAGGVFIATRGLLEEFGPERVKDTPISEACIAGMAVGAAAAGLRPVAEIMFMDFTALAMDQIVNQAAKIHFMFGGQLALPMVIRTVCGGGGGAGPQHSQSLEAWFAHVPGLKVVMPASPYDAKGLLKAAVRDNNPVIYVESRSLYRVRGDVPDDDYIVPLGRADVKRAGKDVTVVAAGRMVEEALKAGDALARRGVSAEVVDLRTISPLDIETVLASVERTHRLVVAHDAVRAFGIGAEVAARVAEEGFDLLDAPIVRLGALSCPMPFSLVLERAVLPHWTWVAQAVEKLLGLEPVPQVP